MSDPLFVLAVLALSVVASELLVRWSFLRHFGTALLVIIVAAIAANLGVIPTFSPKVPVYGGVFTYLAPMAIFWLLLEVDLKRVMKAGAPLLALFLVGSLGTMAGVFGGMWIVDGEERIGALYPALAGMFVGTYTGGSINFNAIAYEYRVFENGIVYAAANAVDSLMTTIWMAMTLVIPRLLPRRGSRVDAPDPTDSETAASTVVEDSQTVNPMDLGILLALGAGAVFVSTWLAEEVQAQAGVTLPSILVLTTLALILAQMPAIASLRGARVIGMFSVYLFLAVIGTHCDIDALLESGELGLTLLTFVAIAVTIHGLVVFGLAMLLQLDPDAAAVASQANIGGGTSALALARSLGRGELVLPAILVGALGSGLGTYLGFLTVQILE